MQSKGLEGAAMLARRRYVPEARGVPLRHVRRSANGQWMGRMLVSLDVEGRSGLSLGSGAARHTQATSSSHMYRV